jgi:hypothetical protein
VLEGESDNARSYILRSRCPAKGAIATPGTHAPVSVPDLPKFSARYWPGIGWPQALRGRAVQSTSCPRRPYQRRPSSSNCAKIALRSTYFCCCPSKRCQRPPSASTAQHERLIIVFSTSSPQAFVRLASAWASCFCSGSGAAHLPPIVGSSKTISISCHSISRSNITWIQLRAQNSMSLQ